MHICLSSGARHRYRIDILRALALPKGARLQFRYGKEYLAPDVLEAIKNGGALNNECLIAYIDQSDRHTQPDIIPCRKGKIVGIQAHGSTYTLQIEVGQFAHAPDIGTFNRVLQYALDKSLPHWQDSNASSPKGYYWLSSGTKDLGIVQNSDLDTWEAVVGQLARRTDFSNESLFFTVRGIRGVNKNKPVALESGLLKFKSNTAYEVDIYHFHPSVSPSGTIRSEISGGAILEFGAKAIVDSRYDLKRVRLRTKATPWTELGLISVYRTISATSPAAGDSAPKQNTEQLNPDEWQFDLPFETRGATIKTALLSLLIGALISAPQILAYWRTATSVSVQDGVTYSLLMLAGASIAALVAAFSLRRPF